MNDVAAVSLQVHSLTHDLTAYEDLRKERRIERAHQPSARFTLCSACSFSDVSNRELAAVRVGVTFVCNRDLSGLGFQHCIQIWSALNVGTLRSQKLNEHIELLAPRSSGAFHVIEHLLHSFGRLYLFKLN